MLLPNLDECPIKNDFVGNKAKGRISKRGVSRKQSTPNFPKKSISYPLILPRTCAGKFGVLCFLETPVWRFALLQLKAASLFRCVTF